jgi:heptosyltransferase-2
MFLHRTDCVHYNGEKPCRFKRLCEGCPHYRRMGERILIIKFGAIGDALRTTPVVRALKRDFPDAHVTWVTDEASYPLLSGNPEIDRLWIYDLTTTLRVGQEQFRMMLNFDKVPAALALAELARAPFKYGFRASPEGNVTIWNRESEYALRLGLDDPLKFRENQKSYQQIIFEMIGLEFAGEEYLFRLSAEEREWAAARFRQWGVAEGEVVVGLNTGCGPVFATKAWTEEGYARLAERLLAAHPRVRLLLLGGPAEEGRNRRLAERLGPQVVDTGCHNPIRLFAALVARCDLLITGDTMAMHVAIACRRRVVVIFGSTCHQEIDLYGRGAKVLTDTERFPCSPCYLRRCPLFLSCMEAMPVQRVYEAVETQLRLLDPTV